MEPQGMRGREGGLTAEARAAGETAKSAAREVAGTAREVAQTRAEGLFESNKQAAVGRMHGMARVLRDASSQTGEDDWSSTATRRIADRIDGFTQAIESRDLSGLLHEAEEYARREPAVFLGGAFAAGFALARFLKASGERRRERFGSSFGTGTQTGYGQGGYGQGYGGAGGYRESSGTGAGSVPPVPPTGL